MLELRSHGVRVIWGVEILSLNVDYLASISVRKEISINFLELFYRKVAAWAIFEKSFVPFLYFGVYAAMK